MFPDLGFAVPGRCSGGVHGEVEHAAPDAECADGGFG